jgi:hypothetical protein
MLTLENKKWLIEVAAPITPVQKPHLPFVPQPPALTLEDFPNGPGTILSKMLSKIGIHSTPNCSCRRRAMEMNTRGPDWCAENMDTIVGWLREESEKRKLPFVDFAGKLLIQRAIKVSRKNLKLEAQAKEKS